MKKRIQEKISLAQRHADFLEVARRPSTRAEELRKRQIEKRAALKRIGDEFNVQILPRQRGPGKADFIKRVDRDENGNHLNSKGEIVLSHIKTKDKPLSPAEQYKLSAFSPHGRMLRQLRRERQDGSEVGLDKRFERDMKNV